MANIRGPQDDFASACGSQKSMCMFRYPYKLCRYSVALLIWSCAIITQSKIVRHCINNCRNWGKISIRCWIHKKNPIPRPKGRAMGCLLWIFVRKFITLKRPALYFLPQPEDISGPVNRLPGGVHRKPLYLGHPLTSDHCCELWAELTQRFLSILILGGSLQRQWPVRWTWKKTTWWAAHRCTVLHGWWTLGVGGTDGHLICSC